MPVMAAEAMESESPLDLSVGVKRERERTPSPPPSLSPGPRDSFTDSEDSDGNPSHGPRKNCKTAYKKSLMRRYCE